MPPEVFGINVPSDFGPDFAEIIAVTASIAFLGAVDPGKTIMAFEIVHSFQDVLLQILMQCAGQIALRVHVILATNAWFLGTLQLRKWWLAGKCSVALAGFRAQHMVGFFRG